MTLYPGIANSPSTTLSSPVTTGATSLPVSELSYFPAAPNIAVVGTGNDAVTYLYTAKDSSSGAGNLTGCSVLEGIDKEWPINTPVRRNLTAKDWNDLLTEITTISSQINGLVTTANKTIYVDVNATGANNGTSWTDAYTSFWTAINSIPRIILHNINVKVKPGTYNPSGATDWTREVRGVNARVIIQADATYSFINAALSSNATAGRMVAAGIDGMGASGDNVMVWDGSDFKGTVEVATVSGEGSGYLDTGVTRTPTSGWNGTVFTVKIGGSVALNCNNLTVIGIEFTSGMNIGAENYNQLYQNCYFPTTYVTGTDYPKFDYCAFPSTLSLQYAKNCVSTYCLFAGTFTLADWTEAKFTNCKFNAYGMGIYIYTMSRVSLTTCAFGSHPSGCIQLSKKAVFVDGGGNTNTSNKPWIVPEDEDVFIDLEAKDGIPTVTGGCAALASTEMATNKQVIRSLDFDPDTIEYAQWFFIVPDAWADCAAWGDPVAYFYWTANDATTNAVRWGIQLRIYRDDEALDQAFGTAKEVTDNNDSAAYDLRVSAATAQITPTGKPATGGKADRGTVMVAQVYRNASAGTDTLTVDARLLAVRILFPVYPMGASYP